MNRKVEIKGQRGSWFATANGEKLPIMWADEIKSSDGKRILTTTWLESFRSHAESKVRQLSEHFEQAPDGTVKFVVAQPESAEAKPSSIKHFVGIFEGTVRQVSPEIELEVTARIADAQ